MSMCEVKLLKPVEGGRDGSIRVFGLKLMPGKTVQVKPDVAGFILGQYDGKDGQAGHVELVSGTPATWYPPLRRDARWGDAARQADVDPERHLPRTLPDELRKALSGPKWPETVKSGGADEYLVESLWWAKLSGLSPALLEELATRVAAGKAKATPAAA